MKTQQETPQKEKPIISELTIIIFVLIITIFIALINLVIYLGK